MNNLLEKMTLFRAYADLIGCIVGGIALIIAIVYFVYAIRREKNVKYFNDLTINLNDENYFSSAIYEGRLDSPIVNRTYTLCNDSLDEYAKCLAISILSALAE